MIEHTYQQLLLDKGLSPRAVSASKRQALLSQVYQFWAPSSSNPQTPPPHSTGAAVDVTLTDASGEAIDMGSPIDELSSRSYPNYFATSADSQQQYHHSREQLSVLLSAVGFQRHPHEWWHFSYGDQLWAWLSGVSSACYGSTT